MLSKYGQVSASVTRYRFPVLAVMGVFVLGLVYSFDPSTTYVFPPCPFHAVTGFYCPGCGSLRATHELLHGHLTAAVGLNPMMILSLAYMALLLSLRFYRNSDRALRFLQNPTHVRFYLGLVLLFWVARNISVYPLSLLAP